MRYALSYNNDIVALNAGSRECRDLSKVTEVAETLRNLQKGCINCKSYINCQGIQGVSMSLVYGKAPRI